MSMAWQIEDVALNIRPSPIESYQDGWLIRASGGAVRRTNCMSPTPHRSADFAPVLEAGEAAYRRLGRPAIVKVLSIGDDIDGTLEARGYAVEGASEVLLAADIAGRSMPDGVRIDEGSAPAEWMAAWARIGGSPAAEPFLRASLAAVVSPLAFAALREADGIVSLAYGIVHRGILGIDAVATRADARGRGLAGHVVTALQHWGYRNGASAACLSVLADNPAAHALYRRAGFDRRLYGYHYRLKG